MVASDSGQLFLLQLFLVHVCERENQSSSECLPKSLVYHRQKRVHLNFLYYEILLQIQACNLLLLTLLRVSFAVLT
jgi:hypothetical protein